ncbi:MAG: hypothetical protein WA191_07220 [Telluria sp.]
MLTKECTACKCQVTLVDFHKSKLGRNGLASICKSCDKAKAREWSAKNREKRAASVKASAQKNPEPRRESGRRWQAKQLEILSNSYVIAALGLPTADCPDFLIEQKREQLQIYRLTKELASALRDALKLGSDE